MDASLLNPAPTRQAIAQDLRTHGASVLTPDCIQQALGVQAAQWTALHASWNDLPFDAHLKDGGRYRKRRHACFVFESALHALQQVPHRAHWQPVDYNALHGGFQRWFEPIAPQVASANAWCELLKNLGELFNQVRPVERWYIEAHQFRIDTANGVGRPTPEGAHRDGVDFVAVILLGRQGIKGGESRVFEADGPQGLRFEMREPLTTLLMDDIRVIHESTPIFALDESQEPGVRDTLVLTYRAQGFQAP